jgi:hypothetical protein
MTGSRDLSAPEWSWAKVPPRAYIQGTNASTGRIRLFSSGPSAAGCHCDIFGEDASCISPWASRCGRVAKPTGNICTKTHECGSPRPCKGQSTAAFGRLGLGCGRACMKRPRTCALLLLLGSLGRGIRPAGRGPPTVRKREGIAAPSEACCRGCKTPLSVLGDMPAACVPPAAESWSESDWPSAPQDSRPGKLQLWRESVAARGASYT